ncbi:MAG: hydrogenase maturation factor, partial [Vallitaleaceae bacterium]|nr:hydrogenase maturation factor [Vallitaleaceae bacterium]
LNPYKLISSGSMLMVATDGQKLVEILLAEGIQAAVIGKITEGQEKVVVQEDTRRSLEPPKSDELYKVR